MPEMKQITNWENCWIGW